MQPVTLSNGTQMPPIGLGLWQVRDDKECQQAVAAAIEAGYRHFDTAQIYGNESYLGTALQTSGIDRDELFITTKIWNENLGWDDLPVSFSESLRNLQLDYVDLLLVHFPVTDYRRPAWRKMEEVAKSGRAKAIGVSNYMIHHLEELLHESNIKPAVNQVELHVYLQQPELIEYCQQHNIVVEAYSPLAHGYGLDSPVLIAIGDKYGKTPAQVMIRWCIERGAVPLPKSVHPEYIRANFNVFDFSLDEADMKLLATLEADYRTCWDPTHVA